MNERLQQFLAELKSGAITIDDIGNSDDILTKEEKDWIFKEYIEFLNVKEKVDDMSTSSYLDPIDIQNTILTWGSKKADRKFTPIAPHHFVLFAGEQSSGKTAFTFDMAIKNTELDRKVLYISLEMTASNIITRVARNFSAITKEQWRDKDLITDIQKGIYKRKRKELMDNKNLILYGFDTKTEATLENIFDVIKAKNPDLVFVDNFDLISRGKESELDGQNSISKKLMDFTNSAKYPIIVIHHLKKSKDKMNVDSVRGSGKITDSVDGLFICTRNIDPEENLPPNERAEFLVIEKKDRDFGEGGIHKFFFHKGTFLDEYEP